MRLPVEDAILKRVAPPSEVALAAYTFEANRTKLPRHEGATGFVTETLQVALLLEQEDSRLVIRVYPGVTGHESFYADTVRDALVAHGDYAGDAGTTPWRPLAPWCLCAGAPGGWDRLETTVRTIRTMMSYFDEVVCAETETP